MINTKKILTNKYYNENDRAVVVDQCLTKNICGNRYYTSNENENNENLPKSDYKIINTVETLCRPQCREDTMLTGPNINTLAILKSSPNKLCENVDDEKTCTKKTTCECCGYQLKLTKCKCKSVVNPLASSNLINSTLCQFAGKTRCP